MVDGNLELAANNAPQLDPIFDFTEQEEAALSPIVSACLRVARDAHEGEVRRKSFDMPYVHHVIASCKLLQESGIQEPFNLGAALLHDALEQGKYCGKEHDLSSKIYRTIIEEYKQKGMEEDHAEFLADTAAEQIIGLIREVTNERSHEDKWFEQADRVGRMSISAQRIKLADMTASVLDDLLYGCTSSIDRTRDMHNRARSIAMQCAPVRSVLYGLFDVISKHNQQMLERGGPIEGMSFDIRQELDDIKVEDVKLHKRDKCSLHWINDKEHQTMSGVVSASFNSDGKVCAYRIVVDPQRNRVFKDIADNVNDVASEFAFAISAHEPDKHRSVMVGRPTIFDDRLVTRKMTLTQPMDVEKFISVAKNNQAITHGFGVALEREAQTVQQAHSVEAGGRYAGS